MVQPLDAVFAPFSSGMSAMIPFFFVMIVVFSIFMIFSSRHADFFFLPLLAIGGLMLIVVALPAVRMFMELSGLSLPTPEADVKPYDWSWFWSLWWYAEYVFGAMGILTVLYALYHTPSLIWALFVWYVSPPPIWLARWLKRPLLRYVDPKTLETSSAQPVLIASDDPVLRYADRVDVYAYAQIRLTVERRSLGEASHADVS